VEQKRFYQWWYALLNQYHHQPSSSLEAVPVSSAANHNSNTNARSSDSNNAANNGEARRLMDSEPSNENSNRGNLTVEMGHASEGSSNPRPEQYQPHWHYYYYYFQQWIQRHYETHIPAAWRESVPWQRLVQLLAIVKQGMQRFVAAAGGPSFVMLLYNAHVLWSCRACITLLLLLVLVRPLYPNGERTRVRVTGTTTTAAALATTSRITIHGRICEFWLVWPYGTRSWML
jgi:hypothetical protein